MNILKVLQLIVIIISLSLLVTAILKFQILKSGYWILMLLSFFFYSIGYYLELDAGSLEAAYMGLRIQYSCTPFIPVMIYLFIRDYGNRPIQNGWQTAMFFVIPLLAFLMANTYPDIRLLFQDIRYEALPKQHLVVKRGPAFYLFLVYSYTFFFLSGWEVVKNYEASSKTDRLQKKLFLAALFFCAVPALITGLPDERDGMQLGSASLVVSIMLLHYYISHYRIADWFPYNRQKLLDYVGEGFLLLDRKGRYIDGNQAVIEYFDGLAELAPGESIKALKGFPGELLEDGHQIMDLKLKKAGKPITVRASRTILNHRQEKLCICIFFYDVTDLYLKMEELEIKATHDSLTKLRNRDNFFFLASRDYDLHIRTHTEGALLMIDIDYFKKVNDEYGHQVGDKVLREFGGILIERLRHTDIIGRYGGEEFCVFLPATNVGKAVAVANDIRRAVEHKSFAAGGTIFHVTVSIGISRLKLDCTGSLEEMIREADQALYQAKNGGRNKAVFYDPEGV